MTTTEVLRILWRRWYLVLAGLALTALVAFPVLTRAPVYFTDVQVQLVPPAGPERGLTDRNEGLIALAGLVERSLGDRRDAAAPVSPQVSLVDMGIREDVLVMVPDSGGQWSTNFTQPVLQVQAVDTTPEAAVARREDAVAEVESALRQVQLDQGVAASQLVVTRQLPDDPDVVAATGSRPEAAAVVGLLGLLLTVLAVAHADHLPAWLRRRRRRRPTVGDATIV